jgi:hypothetical protein
MTMRNMLETQWLYLRDLFIARKSVSRRARVVYNQHQACRLFSPGE